MSKFNLSYIDKPYKVVFVDGPYNGAFRYYKTLRAAKSAARRYCSCPIAGRFVFKYPSCEILFINDLWEEKFITAIL